MSETVEIQSKPWLFKPGQSGNPGGKPKGSKHFTTLFKEAVKKIADGENEPNDILIVNRVVRDAKRGNYKAIDTLLDRVDGPVEKTGFDLTGATFNVIQISGDIVNGKSTPEDLS